MGYAIIIIAVAVLAGIIITKRAKKKATADIAGTVKLPGSNELQ